MTRLQKKCLIAAAGAHLLLLVALFCSGFIRPAPKADNSTVLDVIPANLVDAALNSGVKSAQPPPTPVVTPPQPVPMVTPPQPVTPPTPAPRQPTLMEKVEKMFTPVPDNTPAEEPIPPKHEIKVDLTPVTRVVPRISSQSTAEDAKEEKRLREERRKAFAEAARAIKDNTSSATTVDMPGSSSVSYANYNSVVKSIYEQSWVLPDDSTSDDDNVRVKVVIASDGRVISSEIVAPSGDTSVDASVQRTLDRVTFIAPFPEGATEKERTFFINFNLKAKRMLG